MIREAYEALEGAKDFQTFEAGWKAATAHPEAHALLDLIESNPAYVVAQSRWVRVLREVVGR